VLLGARGDVSLSLCFEMGPLKIRARLNNCESIF
jgi:hypothetical protein